MNNAFKLSLAPIAYSWSREETIQFYDKAMHWPVDIVYLGEVVCSRRHQLKLADYLAIAKTCRDAGKQAVISSLTLLESEANRQQLHKLIDVAISEQFLVEANDLSAVRLLHAQSQPFIAGSQLNIYNEGSLAWFHQMGAYRFSPPLEINHAQLRALQMHRPFEMETEVQVWGKMALAFSSRCFTARHHHLHKDSCEFICQQYPDGLALSTREQSDFLSLNGIQIQSATCLDLGPHLPELEDMQVEILRLQPQSNNMAEIVRSFDLARGGNTTAIVDKCFLPPKANPCNGYWFGKAGMNWAQQTESLRQS